MSLADRIPAEDTTIGRSGAKTVFWLASCTLCGAFVVFYLLQRLGLPGHIVVGTIIALTTGLILTLAWISRTMTSYLFFFANRALGSFAAGMGSTTDMLSGVFLIIFFSTILSGKMILATSLVLGIVFHAALFSASFQRSGVSSLPGYFAWRSQSQLLGYFALLTSSAMLLALAMAEFSVARDVFQILSGMPAETTVWVVLVLAVLPSVFGGWTGLLLVNATLTIWMVICTLTPAVAIGFFSPAMALTSESGVQSLSIEPLKLLETTLLTDHLTDPSPLALSLILLSMAAGFSVLPHALSRLSTTGHAVEAIESVGWLALTVFLMFSALPLSVGLVVSQPTSSSLAALLQGQPVLQILPYFAVLFAALNGLATSLFAVASSAARASNRFRNRNPGEQSVFSTRLCILLVAMGLATLPQSVFPPIDHLFFGALMLGAGGLFIPLLASAWFMSPSSWGLSMAIVCGTALTGIFLSTPAASLIPSPLFAGAIGAAASSAVLLIDSAIFWFRGPTAIPNSSTMFLRRH